MLVNCLKKGGNLSLEQQKPRVLLGVDAVFLYANLLSDQHFLCYYSFISEFNFIKSMFNSIVRFFDRLEDKVRAKLSHRSIIYAFIGGACTVLFWRGIWHTGDILMAQGGFWSWFFYEPITVIWTSVVLLLTGLFVSNFIGERIIISGLKKEKKVTDRTEDEVEEEVGQIRRLDKKVDLLMKEVISLKDELAKK